MTKRQTRILEEEWAASPTTEDGVGSEGWFEVLRPQEKELACGDGKQIPC